MPDQPQHEESRGKKAESPQNFPVPASKEREGSALPAWEGEGQSSALRAAPLPIVHRPGQKPLASPAVRRRAWDLGIELQFVPGSGPGGRITHQDLDAYVASRPGSSTSGSVSRGTARRDDVEDVPVVGLRRAIAEHLQKSKRQIPHFSYIEEVDVTAVAAAVPDPRAGQRRRSTSSGQRPL
jgi:2-oxoisovalerate dehydrogenase E2 component (dihydrolipoyl transacylase)